MIILKDVNKIFTQKKSDDFYALKNINLTINDGECIVFNGVSGSGKSTLLSIIGAIMKPTSGAVKVNGKNIVSLSDYHISHYRNVTIGFVTQSFHLFDELSVKENLLTPLVINDMSTSDIDRYTEKAMQQANILHKANQKVYSLSGGEKQRCMIARALVNNPSIILCDEPTANLDKENTLIFINIMEKLKELGKTIVIATHDPLFDQLNFINKTIKIKDGVIE